MNLLVVVPTYRPANFTGSVGGGEISNRLLMEQLVSLGHKVAVATIAGTGRVRERINGIAVSQSRVPWLTGRAGDLLGYVRFGRVARRLATSFHPDVVLTTTSALPVGVTIARSLGVRCGLLVRAFENIELAQTGKRSHGRKLSALVKRTMLGDFGVSALPSVDFIIANSEFMRSRCCAVSPSTACHVVYPPIDGAFAEYNCRLGPVCSVAMVGTSPKKGVAIFESLARDMPRLSFKILGCPDEDIGRPSPPNLKRLGWCDVSAEFDAVDLVLVPSLCDEAFGRVAVEALLANAIVLVSEKGGLPEAVAEEPSLMVAAGQLDAWRQRVRDVVASPNRYRAASARAANKAKFFGIESQGTCLEEILLRESGG